MTRLMRLESRGSQLGLLFIAPNGVWHDSSRTTANSMLAMRLYNGFDVRSDVSMRLPLLREQPVSESRSCWYRMEDKKLIESVVLDDQCISNLHEKDAIKVNGEKFDPMEFECKDFSREEKIKPRG